MLWQVRRDDGVHRIRSIQPPGDLESGTGLPGFFVLSVRDSTGAVVSSGLLPFCPSGDFGLSRTDFNGPD